MKVRHLLTDDDAVSPVIGVILMVAITVILAAVIASFVLGLGNQAGQTSPQASFSIEYENGSYSSLSWEGNITVTHDSGDSIPEDALYMRGSNFYQPSNNPGTNQTWEAYVGAVGTNDSAVSASASGSAEGETAVVAGDAATFGAKSDYELRVVWQSEEGGNSNTFREDTGPDA